MAANDTEMDADIHPSKTILTAITLYFPLFLVGFVTFEILRRKCRETYAPRLREEGTTCPGAERSSGVLGWIYPVLAIPDDDILEYCGLDTLIFLRLLRMGEKFAGAGILLSVLLFPLYATGTNPHEGSRTDIDPLERITMSNLSQGEGRLWASLIAMYVMSFFAMYLFQEEYKVYVKRRHEFMGKAGPQQYSVVINYLPKKYRSSQTLRRYLDGVFPGSVHSVHVALCCDDLEKLVGRRLEIRNSLEHALALYSTTGERPTHRRAPAGTQTDSIQYFQEKLERLNAAVVQEIISVEKRELESTRRIEERTGVASISSEPPETEELTTDSEAGGDSRREDLRLTLTPQSTASSSSAKAPHKITRQSAFVSFRSLKAAQAAQQLLQTANPVQMLVGPAPAPEDVVWENIGTPRRERISWQVSSWGIFVAIMLFWTIPTSFVASLATVERLSELIPGLAQAFLDHPWLKEGAKQLSPLGLILMSVLAVIIFGHLSMREGHPSQGQVAASLFSKLIYFQTFQIFFVSIIAGTVLESIAEIIEEPKRIVSLLGTAMPGQATNFMVYLVVQFGLKLVLELLRVVPIILGLVYKVGAPTLTKREREAPWLSLKPVSQAGQFEHVTKLPYYFQAILLVFAFCAIAPLLSYFAGLFLLMSDVVYRRQVTFVYSPTLYSAGLYWPKLHDCLVGALVLSQVTFLGLMTLKVAPGPITAATVLPFFSLVYFIYVNSVWPRTARNLPLATCSVLDAERPKTDGEFSWDFLDGVYRQPVLKETEELRPENEEQGPDSSGSPLATANVTDILVV